MKRRQFLAAILSSIAIVPFLRAEKLLSLTESAAPETFTLASHPIAGVFNVYYDGKLLGLGKDYTVSGNKIAFKDGVKADCIDYAYVLSKSRTKLKRYSRL